MFPVEKKVLCHLRRDHRVRKGHRGDGHEVAEFDFMRCYSSIVALVIAPYEFSLKNIGCSLVLELEFDRSDAFSFRESFKIKNILALFKLLGCRTIERPQDRIQESCFANAVLRVDQRYVLFGRCCECELVFAVELAKVVEANL